MTSSEYSITRGFCNRTAESTSHGGEPSYGPDWLSRPEARQSNTCGNISGSQRSHV